MPTKILTTAAVALAALLLSSPGAGPAQALSFGPVATQAEIQASSSIELAAMRGSGHRVWTLNRGGFGGSRFAYRGGNYGRSYGRSYGARRYGHAYPWRHRYVNGRYYRHGYRRGYPWWGYGAVGLGFGGYYGGYYGDYGYGDYGDYGGYGAYAGDADYGYGGGGYASGGGDEHVSWCMNRYRSYDPGSDTFGGYDGLRHRCRGPY